MDIIKSNRIEEKLKVELSSFKQHENRIIEEVESFIKCIEPNIFKVINYRKSKKINKNVLNKFFRSKERIEYRKFILQYLIKFMNKLPTKQEIRTMPVNPYKQFKSFVQYNLDLLKETDVTNCILREYKKRFEWNEESSIYCQKHIDKYFKHIEQYIKSSKTCSTENFCKLFLAIQELCVFWFSVKNEDINHVRKSDLYIYQLTLLLLNKYSSLEKDKHLNTELYNLLL